MLKSFKEQLKKLVIDPQDQFHAHLRKRVGKRATALLEKRLKQMILLMPGIVGRTYELWSRAQTPMRAKSLGGYLLSYMYHPMDFFPEEKLGLLGYLDDAYVAALVYEEVIKDIQAAGFGLDEKDEKTLRELQPLKRAARLVIPQETKKIETMIQEIKEGGQETYLALFQYEKAA